MILFGFQSENNRDYVFDSVSVVNLNATGTELLQNGNFDSSSSTPTGWDAYCSTTCSGTQGSLVNGSACHGSTGTCFQDGCYGASAMEFLGQTFSASIGSKYTISFWLIQNGNGVSAANNFYFDII